MTSRVLRNRAAAIKKGNAKFLKMTKAEKRVAIAKDVIAQIEVRRLVPKNMTFLDIPEAPESLENDANELRDVLLTVPTCEVCAKGALFVCAVERMDKLTVGQYTIGADRDYMLKLFTPKQWDLIESAFEGWSSIFVDGMIVNTPKVEKFSDQYPDPADRMVAIMKNIIKNHGTFKP